MQCNCLIGLFPELERAWLTIDSDIYVWRFSDGRDLAYFDGLADTILSVGLLEPKKGIFRPHIRHLLCLTTPVEIVLLGVTITESDTNGEEMQLLPEPLFTLSTDSTHMLCVKGTSCGRYVFNYTCTLAVFLICRRQTAILDLPPSANGQQTAKNIPYKKFNFLE